MDWAEELQEVLLHDVCTCVPTLLRARQRLLHIPSSTMPKLGKNIRVLRDIRARQGVKDNEVVRRAYLFVARNQALPPQVRYQAQLQLNTFGRYTRPTTVKNRCVESGRGRGIISEFGLSRFQFRQKALDGALPGVQKASW